MNYKLYKIKDVIQEIAMGPFGSNIKVDSFVAMGIPVLNGSNMTGYKLKEDNFNYITVEKAKSLKKSVASRGDIIITHRGTLGQVVYIQDNSKYDKYVISQSQFRIRCNNNIVMPEYLVYYFHSREGQYKLLSNSSQVGVPALARPTSTFQEIELSLPTIEIQENIVNILNSINNKIDVNSAINDYLAAA